MIDEEKTREQTKSEMRTLRKGIVESKKQKGGLTDATKLRRRAEQQLTAKHAETDDPQTKEEMQRLLHELQVHQIELEMQNEELRRTQQELEKSRDQYSHLYDFAPVGYLTLSDERIIEEANLTAATMLGIERKSLIGKPFSHFILRADQDIFYLHQKRVLETETPHSCDLRVVKSDEHEFHAHLECIVTKEESSDSRQIRVAMTDINELKRAEDALRESEFTLTIRNRLFKVFLTFPDDEMYGEALQVVLETLESPFGTFAYINEQGDRVVASMTKDIWDRCEIPDKSYVFPRDSWHDTLWAKCLIGQKTVSSEGPFHTPDGHIPITRALAVPILYQGKAIGSFIVGNKATGYSDRDKGLLESIAAYTAPILNARLHREKEEQERKLAEEALKLSEARFSTIFHASPVSIALARLSDSKLIDVNNAWLNVTGLTREEAIGRTPIELNVWIDPGKRDQLLHRLLEQNTLNNLEIRLRHKSGVVSNMLVSAELIELGGEKCALTLAQDVTKLKRSQEELHQSEVRFRALVEGAPEAIFVQSGGRFIYLNPAMVSLLGASKPEELLDKDCMAQVAPEYRESVRDRIALQCETGKPAPLMEQEYLRLDGSRVPVETTAVPIRFLGSDAHLVFLRNITERKHSEEALREREEVYRAIVDQAAEGIVLIDSKTLNFVEFNDAACHGLGYSREEFARLTLLDLQGILTREEVTERVRELVKAGVANFENQQRHKDGTLRDVLISNRLIGVRGREYIVGIWQDITEQKRFQAEQVDAEAQLREAQKMEALGTLAGGVAHDFNNILGIIIGFTELALLNLSEKASMGSELHEVLKAANRAKDLVRQILAFSRRGEQEERPVQVGLIVNEVLKMLRSSLPSTIEIKQNVASKAFVMADPTQIHQMLMNLCTNSAHAMQEDAGVLQVALTDVRLGPESIPSHWELQPGPHVKLTVQDTGHGIDPSILDRIFDPFFTTKGPGVGTGLGLSVVHGIVKSHKGTIVVKSLPGQGTTFEVLFPAIEAAAEVPAMAAVPLPHGNERILVVDDEPALARAAKQMLERLGYQVEFRTNGIGALQAVRQQSKEKSFDLVITDMTMPHLTGAGLARELLKLQPDLVIVLCTGFSETMDKEKAKSLGIQGYLKKPVVFGELAAMVRKVLDEKGATAALEDNLADSSEK